MEAETNDRLRTTEAVASGKGQGNLVPLHSSGGLYLGLDIGSTSSDIVVLDQSGRTLVYDYRRTKGKPIETAVSQLREILKQVNPPDIVLSAITGSAGRLVAKLLNISFVNEIPAQAAAVYSLYPHLQRATIIEMGGQDSKLIFLSAEHGRGTVSDFAINAVCAAGTGSFLDQQAQRLGVDIENQFGQLALQSKAAPRMAGRCSVFAKSDMIHLQQQATPTCDIIAGLCLALVRNLKSDLGCGREFVKPIIFTGGVAANIGVVKALEQVFKLTDGELIVPKEHFFTGAIGAVLVAKGRADGKDRNGRIRLEKIEQYLEQRSSVLKKVPRREPLSKPSALAAEGVVYEKLLSDADGLINAYLGVDVGSISTKAVVVDEQKRVLAKVYLMTAGQPLEAVRQCLDVVGRKVAGRVRILAAATTGSGRYLTGDFIGADVVVNEITAQAAGAAIVDPKVDTIFEIGGQDSKYISLENGVVVDFEMNHACAAGTGSFLEEQAQRLGINIKDEFSALALSSNAPIKLGERCTVFMESDLLSYQQQDVQTGDLVAGLSYAIVTNYLNRVVGRRKIGSRISFQGGTAFNKAVWSAFEKVTGKPVLVPDHHEVTGALGAAAIAAEYMKNVHLQTGQCRSKFRGFENLVSLKYDVESFTCEHCPNHCDIKKVQIPGAGPLCYGSRCDRYNLEGRTAGAKVFDAFEYRGRKLLEFAGLTDEEKGPPAQKARIGIPGCLFYWQLLPLFARFFGALGFEVVLSGRTDKRIIRMGTESVTAQPCFPVKVAHGHIAELLDKDVDYVFLPSIVSMMSDAPCDGHNQLCPYVQSLPYQVKAAFAGRLGRTKLLIAPVRLGEGQRLLQKSFLAIGRELGVSGVKVRRAVEEGLSAQAGFEQALRIKGREILETLGPGRKLFVLVSRPYNGCDEGLNLRLPRKLAELDAQVIPMDMLDLDTVSSDGRTLYENVYWTHGWKILRAAEIIKKDPRLFAIYLSNFSCGPDSFLMTFFKDIMSPKPCLQIEIDEHSADAGLITRLEAFLDSLRHYHGRRPAEEKLSVKKPTPPPAGDKRRLYVPYMSDCAYGVAACFRSYGQPAEVMPIADEQTLLQGRAFTTGKECLPCAITAGDMLNVIKNAGPDNTAFFMPGGCGPCRFGMYNCMHRLILRYAGAAEVPVISPNQDTEFYKELADSAGEFSTMRVMRDMWTATVGIDLLQKLLLRVRPFARDPRRAQQVYERSLAQWASAVEKRWNLSRLRRLMDGFAGEFADVELDGGLRKPRIGVVGEIYVRSHPFANMNIIGRLEELGAACDLAPLAEWVYYTNFTRGKKAARRRLWRNLFANVVQNYMQHRIEKTLAVPLEARFGRLAEEPIEHTIELARPYLHHSFEGEAILSIGKMVEYYHRGFGGVVNVMPFTCMPSTIVSSQARRVSADCGGMPILNLSFDGQENATLTTRLEAFVEQVRHRQNAVVSPAEVLSLL